jgi:hypothetical protein
MTNELKRIYKSLPIKIRLFLGMLVASNTAALAIFLSLYFTQYTHDYQTCLGVFLAYRVCAFIANKGMMLNDENVAIMSSERTLWNTATIAVAIVMIPVLALLNWL